MTRNRISRRNFIATASGAAIAGAVSLNTPAGALLAAPFIEKTDLFEAGKGGYAIYRIPGMVATKKGTLLAYCEARLHGRGDWGTIDILMRRSTDGGKTWDAPRKIADVPGPKAKNPVALAQNLAEQSAVTYNNPVAIADEKTGAVHFLFCLEYMRCFYMRSDDEGKTFSKPVEITSTFERFKPEYDWKVIATGPGHGIQTRSGRMIVPVWLSTGTGGHAHRPSAVSVIYSDDAGRTWKRGEFAAKHSEAGEDAIINPSETVAVIRSESKQHRRVITTSRDGATGWTKPTFDPALTEPISFGSLERIKAGDKNRILFSNPDNLYSSRLKGSVEGSPEMRAAADRKNLTIRMSYDDAQTWLVSKVIEPGFAGYPDIIFIPKYGLIFALYERGGIGDDYFRSKALTLARFNLEWLTDGKDSLEGKK
jgi:sialidase-1